MDQRMGRSIYKLRRKAVPADITAVLYDAGDVNRRKPCKKDLRKEE